MMVSLSTPFNGWIDDRLRILCPHLHFIPDHISSFNFGGFGTLLRIASIISSDFCPSNLVSLFKHSGKKPLFSDLLLLFDIYENHMSISCQSSWISVIKTPCTIVSHLIPFEDKHFCGSLSHSFFLWLHRPELVSGNHLNGFR